MQLFCILPFLASLRTQSIAQASSPSIKMSQPEVHYCRDAGFVSIAHKRLGIFWERRPRMLMLEQMAMM